MLRWMRAPGIFKIFFPSFVWRYNSGAKKVYLTFDDGPIPESTLWTLNLLKEKNIKATFFCVGDNVHKYPELYQNILTDGHAVGNHTYNHLKGWSVDTQRYIENVIMASDLIDSKLFRPPYGLIKNSQAKHLLPEYKIIMWDVLSGDFRKDITPEQCLRDVLKKVRPGSIISFHNHQKTKANMQYAVPRLIDELKLQGYEFDVCR
ncbi:polysaccharide deacetylase family protein [Labilibaculum filiforme]|uniref:Polysaccharide deacetylase family protein n=1 Tax=Labilibaculum filiforme TaxID=1940526 RepID=A0A2N3HWP8_9BACT|nr:polysaccharide deacetylase family protein [Labilibaculum filiforme]PKQ62500.1 polysaccharide deacetylase family protein [Labilibaculum filiforme]